MREEQYKKCVDRISFLLERKLYDQVMTVEILCAAKKFLLGSEHCPNKIYFGMKGNVMLEYEHPCYENYELTLDIVDEEVIDIYVYSDIKGLELMFEQLNPEQARAEVENFLFSEIG